MDNYVSLTAPPPDPNIARLLRNGPMPSASPDERRMYQELAEWHAAHPAGTWAEFSQPRRQREEDERQAAADKLEATHRAIRETFKEASGDPARLVKLYRGFVGRKAPTNEVEHELAIKWVGSEMWGEVMEALDAPRKRVYKPALDKVVTYDGPKKDRSTEPYWDQVPAGVRKAVAAGRCKPIDESVAAVIWQHNRRVYRAVKDKVKRINVREIAAQLRVTDKTVQRSISRMVAAGELEVVSGGKGNHAGTVYSFPARESEHAHGTLPDTKFGASPRV